MLATVRVFAVMSVLAGSLAVAPGCSTVVRVAVDEAADFGAYHSWGWSIAAQDVPAESTVEQSQMALAVAAAIHEVMTDRGFVYHRSEPDLLVAPELHVQRREEVVHMARSNQFVPSLHASPSYLIEQMSMEETRIVDQAELEIVVTDRVTGRVVWRGRYWGRFSESFMRHAHPTVATLMQSLPAVPDVPSIDRRNPTVAQVSGARIEAAR